MRCMVFLNFLPRMVWKRKSCNCHVNGESMLTITTDKNILEKLAALLRAEASGSCVRLKEYTIGGG